MMELDEAIRHAEEVAEEKMEQAGFDTEEHRQLAEWLKELKRVRELPWLKELKELRAQKRPHGEWIPCSERLPEESGQYYVSGGDKVWICDFLIIPTFKGGWCNNVSNPVVEAWMPLPEPYKRGKEE